MADFARPYLESTVEKKSFNKQITMATATSTVAVRMYVIILCSFPWRYKTTTWKRQILRIWENVNYDGEFSELLFQTLTLCYLFFLEYLWQR